MLTPGTFTKESAMRMHAVIAAFSALATSACGAEEDEVVAIRFVDPPLPTTLMMDGCRMWGKHAVRCAEAKYANDADVTVTFVDGPCGGTLASAGGGEINVMTRCFMKPDGTPLPHLKQVFAHEVGHLLGIDHIVSACDFETLVREKTKVDGSLQLRIHPNGEPICGPAIMNPAYNGVRDLMRPDDLAFDLRTNGDPVYRPRGETYSCTYGIE